jgi:hypothetical protein
MPSGFQALKCFALKPFVKCTKALRLVHFQALRLTVLTATVEGIPKFKIYVSFG